jgi:hypothetical protein
VSSWANLNSSILPAACHRALNLLRQVLKPIINGLKTVSRYDFRFARPARSLYEIKRTARLSEHAVPLLERPCDDRLMPNNMACDQEHGNDSTEQRKVPLCRFLGSRLHHIPIPRFIDRDAMLSTDTHDFPRGTDRAD